MLKSWLKILNSLILRTTGVVRLNKGVQSEREAVGQVWCPCRTEALKKCVCTFVCLKQREECLCVTMICVYLNAWVRTNGRVSVSFSLHHQSAVHLVKTNLIKIRTDETDLKPMGTADKTKRCVHLSLHVCAFCVSLHTESLPSSLPHSVWRKPVISV